MPVVVPGCHWYQWSLSADSKTSADAKNKQKKLGKSQITAEPLLLMGRLSNKHQKHLCMSCMHHKGGSAFTLFYFVQLGQLILTLNGLFRLKKRAYTTWIKGAYTKPQLALLNTLKFTLVFEGSRGNTLFYSHQNWFRLLITLNNEFLNICNFQPFTPQDWESHHCWTSKCFRRNAIKMLQEVLFREGLKRNTGNQS